MATLHISALEGQHEGEVLEAQFNPKEIVLAHAILWQQQVHKGPADLEFEQAEPARMSFELLFDGAEASSSVQPQIDKLHHFSSVDAILRRPPKVQVSWGSGTAAMPTFAAVIESVTVRYALFAENGLPVRATVDVKLKQAAHLGVRAS
jgi:Contractile injection system tube protein